MTTSTLAALTIGGAPQPGAAGTYPVQNPGADGSVDEPVHDSGGLGLAQWKRPQGSRRAEVRRRTRRERLARQASQ